MSGFPWAVFSANTLRPMVSDLLRSGGYALPRLSKEASIALLENIEKHGLETALKGLGVPTVEAGTRKRKHPEEEEAPNDAHIGESSSQPLRKRGRPRRGSPAPQANANTISESVSAPAGTSRSRGRNSDLDQALEEGLLTRRQAARKRGENVPATRSFKSPPRSPRKTAAAAKKNQAAGSKSSVSNAKPTSTGKKFFDGVELMKRPESYDGKGKDTERETREGETELDACSDLDAEGEEVELDDAMPGTASSSLQNSNKENEISLTELANADTDIDADGEDAEVREIGSPAPEITVDLIEAARPKGQDALIPDVPEIGSPAPQIAIEPTDDQIEEARLNHDPIYLPNNIDIGSPAPEITIEPMAEDDGEGIQFEPRDEVTVQFEENGHSEEGGFLHARPRPQLDIQRAGTPLNPEYSIEVFSPGSAQHDSDDEMWVASGINGSALQAAGGGLDALD
ncbi:hypothetical protein B0H12DRAFT_1069126 [Mycena haematopus]|nr:hypothetical protein B0H12DRAFT_1069126 [Mycena haematopus]